MARDSEVVVCSVTRSCELCANVTSKRIAQKNEGQHPSLKCWMRHTLTQREAPLSFRGGGYLVQMSHYGALLMKSPPFQTELIPAQCCMSSLSLAPPFHQPEPSTVGGHCVGEVLLQEVLQDVLENDDLHTPMK